MNWEHYLNLSFYSSHLANNKNEKVALIKCTSISMYCMNTFIYRHAHTHSIISSELVSAGGIGGKGWVEKAHPEKFQRDECMTKDKYNG